MSAEDVPKGPGTASTAGRGKRRSRWRRRGLSLAAVCGLGLAVVVLFAASAPDPASLLAFRPQGALEIVDQRGELLRLLPNELGLRYLPVEPEQVSPHLLHALFAAEDRRFFAHPGIDPLAVLRAGWQNVRAGRVVSGGSTLTMQLARLLDPRPRSMGAKLRQAALALRLEWALSKKQILAEYLGRAPLGNRVLGYEAAARVYFGKSARQLSPAEAALLAAVPRSPSRTNPWRGADPLRIRRDQILEQMYQLGFIDHDGQVAALAEPVVLREAPFQSRAPHAVARLAREFEKRPAEAVRLVSTIDLVFQKQVEAIVHRRLTELKPDGVKQMAVVVLDLVRHELIALVGSGCGAGEAGAEIDGARAPRQPGSALKPFTYALAFAGNLTPATILPDIQQAFPWKTGTWIPKNYDQRYHGPLRAREALACSVNVPAALALRDVTPERLLEVLRSAGITTLTGSSQDYGLALTLGAGEVRLDELTAAYGALLEGGVFQPSRSWRALIGGRGQLLARPPAAAPRQILTPESSAQVTDILADPEARAAVFGRLSVLNLPFPAAVKTGTSEGFHDNWCIGGTREVVVGVWAGNFDRTPMGNVSGVTGAGSVWNEVMLAWAGLRHRDEGLTAADTLGASPPALVRAEVCALSGMAPGEACPRRVVDLFRRGQEPTRPCDWHQRGKNGRVEVDWPAAFLDWAVENGLAAAPEQALAVATGPRSIGPLDPAGGQPLAVLYPAPGDAFMITPELPRDAQALEMRCAAEGNPPEVVWFVDGVEFARSAAPYRVRWPLVAGEHRIEVRNGALRSRPVRIAVY